MCNLNAICSTWHLWPRAYRGLCWVSLTLRPCQGKMWSMLLQQELSSTSHWSRALAVPISAPLTKCSGQKKKKSLFCSSLGSAVGKLSLFLPLLQDVQKQTRKSWWKGESFTMVWTRAPFEERVHCKGHSPAPPGREHRFWGKDKKSLNTRSLPGRTD